MLLLCYEHALVPEGGALVCCQTAWAQLGGKEPAGHIFHHVALLQTGVIGEHSPFRAATHLQVSILVAAGTQHDALRRCIAKTTCSTLNCNHRDICSQAGYVVGRCAVWNVCRPLTRKHAACRSKSGHDGFDEALRPLHVL